jgi:hypothetical protein
MTPRVLWLAALAACLPAPDDQDGDGLTELDGDCDDTDPKITDTAPSYLDADGDGFGDDATAEPTRCDAPLPQGRTWAAGDCADDLPEVNPGATEICGEADDDCDGRIDDEDDSTDAYTMNDWREDADDDGVAGEVSDRRCATPGPGWLQVTSADPVDCDDAEPAVYPGNPEVCDGLDNDCANGVDDGVEVEVWSDDDRDGYGAGEPYFGCLTEWSIDNELDCDDDDDEINPDAIERCDPLRTDENCDGWADDDDYAFADPASKTTYPADYDQDGLGSPVETLAVCHPDHPYVAEGGDTSDCDDTDAAIGGPPLPTWLDRDDDGFGDRNDVPQNSTTCSPPPGRVLNGDDCDDFDPATTFDALRYADADGDGIGDAAVEIAACSGDPTPGYVAAWSDCDDQDDARFLFLDSCNSAEGHCGVDESVCTPTTPITVGGWATNFGGWAPAVGDVYDNGFPDVLLGTFDRRRDYGNMEPDQADFQDEARLLIGASDWDPASGIWDVVDVRYTLPFQPSSNLGAVDGVLAAFDPSDPGDEIVLVDADRNAPSQGSIWYVTDPPVSPADGDVVGLSHLGNAWRIDMPALAPDPHQHVGYAVAAGDLDADGIDDLVVTAPTLSYDDDHLYVVYGPDLGAVTSLEDGRVVRITDTGVFADGLGVDVAHTLDYANLEPAIAVTTLGSSSDGPAVVVFEGDRLDVDRTVEQAYDVWFTTTGGAPPSHENSARTTWTDLDGDGTRDDLLFTVTDGVQARLYVIGDPHLHSGRVRADLAATAIYDLPWPDCTELTAIGTRVWLACPNGGQTGVYLRGLGDPGLVFDFALDLTSPGPLTLTTGTTDQLETTYPYHNLGTGGLTHWTSPSGDQVVILDHFTGWTDEGFSWVHVAP